MPTLLQHYVLYFFIASTLGWIMEVVCKLIQFRRFINRGFLIGPYCPIYGFGAVIVTALLSRYTDAPAMVFVMAMVLCGTLEYVTSFLMEKLFHARWWDYSHKRFNLNGRVCADTLIPFGLLGMLMIYVVKPLLFYWMDRWPGHTLQWACLGLLVIFLSDVALSTTILSKIRKTATLSGEDDTEAITRAVREKLADRALARRVMNAFPYVRLYTKPVMERIQQRRREIRREIERKLKEIEHGRS
ncbi:MAG: putative ABC transporter permease [Clostridia bacterium]|nr:putative ABC transporter permease [Clostridia bacterium]